MICAFRHDGKKHARHHLLRSLELCLSFLVLGFIPAVFVILRGPKCREIAIEALLSYYPLFALGLCFFPNFVMHVFFQEMASRFIDWAPSPFETEVGTASLGFAALAFMAFRGSYGPRIGTVIGPSIFHLSPPSRSSPANCGREQIAIPTPRYKGVRNRRLQCLTCSKIPAAMRGSPIWPVEGGTLPAGVCRHGHRELSTYDGYRTHPHARHWR
ncbi:MAG: DUF6790 family protein [Pseudolabrys sp.]